MKEITLLDGEVYAEERNKKWLPYYEKLKAEVLPSIEPKYNI